MNLIEAWKQAKEGQKIQHRINHITWDYTGQSLLDCIKHTGWLTNKDILSDDWEIVIDGRSMELSDEIKQKIKELQEKYRYQFTREYVVHQSFIEGYIMGMVKTVKIYKEE